MYLQLHSNAARLRSGIVGKSQSQFPLIRCRSLANAHDTIISAELRLSTSTHPIDCCKKAIRLTMSAAGAPHPYAKYHCDVSERYPCRKPLYMLFLNAQVLGPAQVISDVIRTSVLASASESGHGKAADEPRVQNHVLYTFLPYKGKSCLSLSLCRTRSTSCDTLTVQQIICNYTLSITSTFTWRSDRSF